MNKKVITARNTLIGLVVAAMTVLTVTTLQPVKFARMLFPLYISPSTGAVRWDPVIAANTYGNIDVIINPRNGPGTAINSDYVTGVNRLRAANVGVYGYVYSGAVETSIYGTSSTPADMSEITVFYKSAIITPPGGGWSTSELNSLKLRIGYSGDITPNPYWQAFMYEVDLVPGGGGGGWSNIAKVDGIASASLAKVNGVAVASISKINGIAV